MDRLAFLSRAKESFGAEPEYLWLRHPGYAVLRNPASGKWFAIVMNVPAGRLGLSGAGEKDLLNVKCDPLLTGSLLSRQGFVPAYHMNKTSRIGILLDGTVNDSDIEALVRSSFEASAPKNGKKGRRKPEK